MLAPLLRRAPVQLKKALAPLPAQVNRLAGEAWAKRVQQLHEFWAPHVLERDADITPVMLASSLLPGAWARDYGGWRRLHGGAPEQ